MTERRRSALTLRDDGADIGTSAVRWENDAFVIDIDETSVPHLGRIKGRVTLRPDAIMETAYPLDSHARHWWRPIAPSARIDVDIDKPDYHWSGAGYFDMNWASEPVEDGFERWDWSRAPMKKGATVLYDATRADGSDLSLALRFDGAGDVEQIDAPPRAALPKTLWRVERRTQADPGATPSIHRRLEDAPFYARSELSTRLFGEDTIAMHETLDCRRFRTRWVKALLPWRMPRL